MSDGFGDSGGVLRDGDERVDEYESRLSDSGASMTGMRESVSSSSLESWFSSISNDLSDTAGGVGRVDGSAESMDAAIAPWASRDDGGSGEPAGASVIFTGLSDGDSSDESTDISGEFTGLAIDSSVGGWASVWHGSAITWNDS